MRGSVACGASGALAAALVATLGACGPKSPAPPAGPADRAANVSISNLPSPLWTVTEGAYEEAAANPPDGHAGTQNLTWLVHLVLTSKESVPLAIDRVEVTFNRGDQRLWTETYSRPYLRRLEWIKGEFNMTPEYYITRVLHGREEPGSPDVPANGAMSWVRIPFARPWFARADPVEVGF